MPSHKEHRILTYSPEQLYTIVADIERYPEFLPWCRAARIRKRKDHELIADLVIGYKVFSEKFTSRVTLNVPHEIEVSCVDGPLNHLKNHWKFKPSGQGACAVDFFVEFEFRSSLMQKTMEMVFSPAISHMIEAFEKRAKVLYG